MNMLKLAIGLGLLILTTRSEASGWKHVGENGSAGELLVDVDTVHRAGGMVSAWFGWPEYHSRFDRRAASALVRTTFYCGTREFQMSEFIMRDKNGHILRKLSFQEERN